jgi:sensor histidine kinase YesM
MAAMPASAALRPALRLLHGLWGEVWLNLLVCLLIAVVLSLLTRSSFALNLVFSLCIGLSIQTLIGLGRHGIARWLIGRGRSNDALREGWPGWRWMGPWVVLSVVLGYEFGTALASLLADLPYKPFRMFSSPRMMGVVLLITLLVSMGFTYAFYSQGRLAAAAAEAQAARRLASEHQLKLLQSQLEPHMLFNTLANLRVLIGLDPQRAQAMLDRLIGYLRATLTASRAEAHPLAAEFDRLADYLALMAIRMGPRLQVVLDLPAPLRDLPVPPLLLQPLVENAIKHGLEPQVQAGRLQVQARQQGQQLVLTVRDTGVGLTGTDAAAPALDGVGTGFGTVQVRERLQALYGSAATLTLAPADDAEGGTLATVTLPWPAPAVPPGAAPAASRPAAPAART